MQLSEIIKEINGLADESEPAEIITAFINDAIAKINVECDANFPFMSTLRSTEHPVFPDKWQRVLLIPFGVGRLKQKDSSQFEYTDAYSEFMMNLMEFKAKYTIPDTYKDLESSKNGSIPSNIYLVPPADWGGW